MSDAESRQFLLDLLRSTGMGSYRAGDLLYASGPNTLGKLSAAPATMLLHGGAQPSWAAVSMADDITGVLAAEHGGTGQASYVLGDLLYASGAAALSRLAGQITTTRKFLRQVGDGALSAAPAWDTVSAADLTDFAESAQDAVGAALTDTSEIDFTYNDAANTISATLINASIVYARLQNATALSVIGRSANSTGVLASIPASADGQVLLSNGSALAFTAPTAPAAGLTISTALVFALANDLAALEALGSTGFPVRTAANTWTQRSIVDVANRTTVTNQDGVAGNTAVDISATYVGQASITTLGTIATGTWQATAVGATFGGTGLAAYTLGDTLYSSATNTLARLTGNTTTTRKFLRQVGDGSASAAPAWDTLVAADVPDMGANPTGTIGLTAVNGTATRSYLRSDGSPALDQTIAPTMSGAWRFSLAGSLVTPTVLLTSAQPVLQWSETDQAVDEKQWAVVSVAKVFQFRSVNDAGSASIVWGSITRGTGTAISNISLGDSTNNNSYTFSSTGTATFSGAVTAPRVNVNGSTVPPNGIYLPGANNPALTANSTKVIDWTSTVATITGDLKLGTAGNGLYVKEGTNATMGVATLVAGTVTVSTTKVTASSRVHYAIQSLGTVAVPQAMGVTARTAGTSFTLTSAALTDTSVVAWQIVEPA